MTADHTPTRPLPAVPFADVVEKIARARRAWPVWQPAAPAVPAPEWVAEHRGECATSPARWSYRDGDRFAHRVPRRWRGVHALWALLTRRFWIPCPLCRAPFGGHEWADRGEWPGTVPVLRLGGGGGLVRAGAALCPSCTALGLGRAAWEADDAGLPEPVVVEDPRCPPPFGEACR